VSKFIPLSLMLKIESNLFLDKAYDNFLKPNVPSLFVFFDLFKLPKSRDVRLYDFPIALNNYSVPYPWIKFPPKFKCTSEGDIKMPKARFLQPSAPI
jgi:hypothetical protein